MSITSLIAEVENDRHMREVEVYQQKLSELKSISVRLCHKCCEPFVLPEVGGLCGVCLRLADCERQKLISMKEKLGRGYGRIYLRNGRGYWYYKCLDCHNSLINEYAYQRLCVPCERARMLERKHHHLIRVCEFCTLTYRTAKIRNAFGDAAQFTILKFNEEEELTVTVKHK